MGRKMKSGIFAVLFLLSLSVSAMAAGEEASEISIVKDSTDEMIDIRYTSVTETEDGSFLFSLTDIIPNSRSTENVRYEQVALVVPFFD